MNGQRVTRRRLLGGVTASTLVGLAGCTSGGTDDGSDDGGGDPTATATATGTATATSTATGTEAPESTTASTEQAGGGASDDLCGPLRGDPTAFDASGTEFVFGFDYVDTWTVSDPRYIGGGRIQSVESPGIEIDGSEASARVRVGQSFEALTASERDEAFQAALDREDADYEVVTSFSYAGETIDVYGLPPDSLPVYGCYLPYGTGSDKRYYFAQLVTFSDIYRPSDDGSTANCRDAVDAAANTILESFRPNPETTIDDA